MIVYSFIWFFCFLCHISLHPVDVVDTVVRACWVSCCLLSCSWTWSSQHSAQWWFTFIFGISAQCLSPSGQCWCHMARVLLLLIALPPESGWSGSTGGLEIYAARWIYCGLSRKVTLPLDILLSSEPSGLLSQNILQHCNSSFVWSTDHTHHLRDKEPRADESTRPLRGNPSGFNPCSTTS